MAGPDMEVAVTVLKRLHGDMEYSLYISLLLQIKIFSHGIYLIGKTELMNLMQ